jgi:hypothetical protein
VSLRHDVQESRLAALSSWCSSLLWDVHHRTVATMKFDRGRVSA